MENISDSMVSQPLITVIIPVYNCKKYIASAIDSVLCQSLGDFELLLMDDCSTDGSYDMLCGYADSDKRVRVYRNEVNSGVAVTRNKGIELAKGKYIALLDSDDLWRPDKLERQYRLLCQTGKQIAYCSHDFIDDYGNEIKKPFLVPPDTDYDSMLVRCVFTCSTVMMESQLLKKHPFEADYYHEDFILWVRLMAAGATAIGDTEVLASYRQLIGSRSNNKLRAAYHRWKAYRGALNIPFFKSCRVFMKYALNAVKKYY